MTLFGRDISPNLVKMSYFKVDTSTVRYLSSLLLQKILMNYEVKVLHVKFESTNITTEQLTFQSPDPPNLSNAEI